ncbi:hypothetical protein [Nocardioides sp.]|uniref:hypothetical protein n=1 Tax=Nocardioides sp. TaxID=35761 RepID=UPI0039E5B8F8
MSIVSPGVFQTGVGGELWEPTRDSEEPAYREAVADVVADWNRIVVGRDPDLVAEAIQQCLTGEDPPARVFVGRNCERGAAKRRELSDDEWARLLLRPLFRRP